MKNLSVSHMEKTNGGAIDLGCAASIVVTGVGIVFANPWAIVGGLVGVAQTCFD